MSCIGAQKNQKSEKEVINEPHWCPKKPEIGKRGHQWVVY
ncbi:hypothetical protein J2S25_003180 [Mesobacillus stamsii]|uniref:Uncharacterized protein n=1 Tax=Mesobacillus stamsii TaxID=225347 RepID=A0ABU0G015_9BACI|nr:hypothetical protein [Mesobacillus stamsii]